MRDEEFFRKLLERLVLRFQGSFAYLGNVKGYAEWSKTAQEIYRDHDNVAVRAMIQMIVHAVVEEVRAIDKDANAPCLMDTLRIIANAHPDSTVTGLSQMAARALDRAEGR